MIQTLKEQVYEANLRIVREGLVALTWGNVSGVDRSLGKMVIKPSGVPYGEMKPKHMVVVSLDSGEVEKGGLRPSSDTPTHLELYRAFKDIGGIVHTHSPHATAWAQSLRDLVPLGTTHADHFRGAVPCTRLMNEEEIRTDYERNTGLVIVERFEGLDPLEVPAVLVASHAPFAWGKSVEEAVKNAMTLERIAGMASETLALNPSLSKMSKALVDKHFYRKHGSGAYYGQPKKGS